MAAVGPTEVTSAESTEGGCGTRAASTVPDPVRHIMVRGRFVGDTHGLSNEAHGVQRFTCVAGRQALGCLRCLVEKKTRLYMTWLGVLRLLNPCMAR